MDSSLIMVGNSIRHKCANDKHVVRLCVFLCSLYCNRSTVIGAIMIENKFARILYTSCLLC